MSDTPEKIDAGSVKRCKLPSPKAELIDAMARDGYAQACESGHMTITEADGTKHDYPPWDALDLNIQDVWRAVARAMYIRIATTAGALVEGIREPLKGGIDP